MLEPQLRKLGQQVTLKNAWALKPSSQWAAVLTRNSYGNTINCFKSQDCADLSL